jgi:hypothetical protein
MQILHFYSCMRSIMFRWHNVQANNINDLFFFKTKQIQNVQHSTQKWKITNVVTRQIYFWGESIELRCMWREKRKLHQLQLAQFCKCYSFSFRPLGDASDACIEYRKRMITSKIFSFFSSFCDHLTLHSTVWIRALIVICSMIQSLRPLDGVRIS